MSEGKVFLLVGPSGAGKNTVQDAVKARFPAVHMAKGVWTRPHRNGETDETADSYSISTGLFLELRSAGMLTADNSVHGNWYGTPRTEFTEPTSRGQHVFRIVTDGGADAIRRDLPELEIVTIYLYVPVEVTVDRLMKRGDTEADIVRRVTTAMAELTRFEKNPDAWTHVVDGTQSRDTVADAVIAIVEYEIGDEDDLSFLDAGIDPHAGESFPPAHRPGCYQLCPCDDCQTTYPHRPESALLNRSEYAKGWTR